MVGFLAFQKINKKTKTKKNKLASARLTKLLQCEKIRVWKVSTENEEK
jgi:hypothetical protein